MIRDIIIKRLKDYRKNNAADTKITIVTNDPIME